MKSSWSFFLLSTISSRSQSFRHYYCSQIACHSSFASATNKGPGSFFPISLNPQTIDFYYNDIYEVPLPPQHRFPMEKYRMVRKILQREWNEEVYDEAADRVQFIPSPLATREELILTHCPNYVDRYCTGENFTPAEIRKTGFPWSKEQVARSLSSTGGTIAAMRNVLSKAFSQPTLQSNTRPRFLCSGQIAGGTHHAFYDYGEGYCIFSDIAVAANVALREYPDQVKRILIIDCDVHQGNGNAKLFHGSSNVITYSIHCKENLFSARQYSTLDVDVDRDCDDDTYLLLLQSTLEPLFNQVSPDLVFLQMGVDISADDRLGRLKVSRFGLQRRNAYLYSLLARASIPTVVTMGGGYPKNLDPTSEDFQKIVQYHADVYRQAITTFLEYL